MNGLEILFLTSALMLLIMWIWFIVLGFLTSRMWGASLIFLFPISPFMFAYRFERKTRSVIRYFLGVLVFFFMTCVYIQFGTIEFYSTLFVKISEAIPNMSFSSKPKVKNLHLPKPTPIPPPRAVTPEPEEEPTINNPKPISIQKHGYNVVAISSLNNYIGKNIIITTATVTHEGRLISASGTQVEIRKTLDGGTTTMGISKSKITKVEVDF